MLFLQPVQPQPNHKANSPKARGFSLVEVMMQLVILSIVTVPMLMLMQLQKHNLIETRQTLMNRLIADQLFDNDMMPYTTNAMLWFGDSGKAYYYSTKCDPVQHDKTPDEYAKTCCILKALYMPDSTAENAVLATCPTEDHPYNRDLFQGPFFTRSYASSANGRVLTTKIKLFKGISASTINPQQPYYTASRTYNLDVSNSDFGNSYNANTPMTPSQFTATMQIDEEGNMWLPQAWNANPPGMTTSSPLLPRPYRSFLAWSGSGGVTTIGTLLPNTVYLFNTYFVSPTTPSSTCFSGTTGTSCSSVTILLYSSTLTPNFGTTNLTLLKSWNNIDLSALANLSEPGQKPIVLTLSFRTPSNARSFYLKILPTPPDSGQTNTMRLSGYSFIRAREQ